MHCMIAASREMSDEPRIYPTVFAWAILGAFIFNRHYGMDYTIIHGGGWFVTCIMIYYVILYMIKRFMFNHLRLVLIIASVITIIWYLMIDRPENYNMYGHTYFKWCHYFLFMLLGAMMGVSKKELKYSFGYDLMKLIGSVVIYYAILFSGELYPICSELQIISLIPLLYIVYYSYKICNSETMKRLYYNRVLGWCMKFIGGLEIMIGRL